MLLEVVKGEIETYETIVINKPISKEMAGHLIVGFSIIQTSPAEYDLYVMGQDLNHSTPIINKPLEEWLKDNNIYNL